MKALLSSQMKGTGVMLYICYQNIFGPTFIGVRKKIMAQCRVFEKEFGKIFYTAYAGQMLYLLLEGNVVEKEIAISKKHCNDILIKWLSKYKIKRTYIRYNRSDLWFVEFLKRQKELNIKSVLEFQTYPYDGEENGISVVDRYYREQLHNYLDCCTTYDNYSTVFDIPCIPLRNGVDINEQKVKQYRNRDGKIILLAVANFSKWHGYERIIQGMYNYYANGGQKNIIFNIVGSGNQLGYYKRLIEEYQICDHVVFHGMLSGERLDDIYDNSDIAIGSLGFYKLGLESGAPIKLREYCARGIPFVYGYDDISFSKNDYFAYQVSNDAMPVDIRGIIDFYNSVYYGKNFIKDMRRYTVDKLTWDTIMRQVIDYLS